MFTTVRVHAPQNHTPGPDLPDGKCILVALFVLCSELKPPLQHVLSPLTCDLCPCVRAQSKLGEEEVLLAFESIVSTASVSSSSVSAAAFLRRV